jgi:hypothetical protein
MIHILDYKPGAKKIKPIEQLTISVLALSHLTGIPSTTSTAPSLTTNPHAPFVIVLSSCPGSSWGYRLSPTRESSFVAPM